MLVLDVVQGNQLSCLSSVPLNQLGFLQLLLIIDRWLQVRCSGAEEYLFLCQEYSKLCDRYPPTCRELKGKAPVHGNSRQQNAHQRGEITAIHGMRVVERDGRADVKLGANTKKGKKKSGPPGDCRQLN